ncbi:MAG: hypothetical protein B9S32_07280 [Verrucomicrobia bacterium Tous-C9LFEB]|nr:MAG: hypothetical protein B9S32_07280 [Verrucomicrobia bacterium Tous-C9LFEB]
MNSKNHYSVILGNLGNTCDRFLPTGYKEVSAKRELIRQAAAIPGIEGVELVGTWDITEKNCDEVRGWLTESRLSCVSIIPDLFSQKRWGNGSFSAKDPVIRNQALAETRTTCQIAHEIGCPLINLWLGQDGYDYPLTANYREQRKWQMEGIRTVGFLRVLRKIILSSYFYPYQGKTSSFLPEP